jgi:hypothetical protein
MRNLININQITTRCCGGYGAWIGNPLSSAAPGEDTWPGFQVGGGNSKRKRRNSYKKKCRNSKKQKIGKISRRYKKTRRNI